MARHIERHHRDAPWYRSYVGTVSDDRIVTVSTELDVRDRERGRPAALQICAAIEASNAADFTDGHMVTGRGGKRQVCPARPPTP